MAEERVSGRNMEAGLTLVCVAAAGCMVRARSTATSLLQHLILHTIALQLPPPPHHGQVPERSALHQRGESPHVGVVLITLADVHLGVRGWVGRC